MPVLKKLSSVIGFRERYIARSANNPDAIQKAVACRKDQFLELAQNWRGEPQLSPGHVDRYDQAATHVLCEDEATGEIVGSLRLTAATVFAGDESVRKLLSLDRFAPSLWPFVIVASKLADRANAGIRRQLLVAAYEEALTRMSGALLVLACHPNDFADHRALGFRAFDRVSPAPVGGHLLPLFLDMHAYETLKILDSPFYPIATRHQLPALKLGHEWYRDFIFENGAIDPGYQRPSGTEFREFHAPLTEGLSERAKKHLLGSGLKINCRFGDVVVQSGASDRSVGLVREGTLEVVRDGELVGILTAGDVFGEIAFLLGGSRSAEVRTASERAEVLLLKGETIEGLRDKDDRLVLWQNLSKLVARRIVTTSAELASARTRLRKRPEPERR